jgi:Glucosyl transferase GtrII
LLQFLTYGYFFTTLIFTNHTFPDSWVFPYPSYKTQEEGRWLADIIFLLQGGSGVQPFQMVIAVALQSLNGLLFARFLGLQNRPEVALAAAFLCLYPAFLDYYCFAMEHIDFVEGDTFALIGILYWKNVPHSLKTGVVSGLLFVLTLAGHQPKIALIGLLCLCYLVMSVAGSGGVRPFSLNDTMLETGYIASIFIGACLAYFLSAKLVITYHVGDRTSINALQEMFRATRLSYVEVFRYFTFGADYLPRVLRFLPALGIALGSLVLLHRAYQRHAEAAVVVVVLLLLIPVALRGSYIINKNSWENVGRMVAANGYALLFFLSFALQAERMRKLALGMFVAFIYFFIVVGTQESNAAALKTIYDLNMINRISARVENVTEDLYQNRYALVIVGQYPEFPRSRYVRASNRSNQPHSRTSAFEPYRQVEILNYFLGKNVLARPTPAQLEGTLASVQGRRPWPAKEAVYLLDHVVVVILEEYRPDISITWSSTQR